MLGYQTGLELSLIALSLDKKAIRMITARVTLFTSCFQSRNIVLNYNEGGEWVYGSTVWP